MFNFEKLKASIESQLGAFSEKLTDVSMKYTSYDERLVVSFSYEAVSFKYAFQLGDFDHKCVVYWLYTDSFYLVCHNDNVDVERFLTEFFSSVIFRAEVLSFYLLNQEKPKIKILQLSNQADQKITDAIISIKRSESEEIKERFILFKDTSRYHIVSRRTEGFEVRQSQKQAESK